MFEKRFGSSSQRLREAANIFDFICGSDREALLGKSSPCHGVSVNRDLPQRCFAVTVRAVSGMPITPIRFDIIKFVRAESGAECLHEGLAKRGENGSLSALACPLTSLYPWTSLR